MGEIRKPSVTIESIKGVACYRAPKSEQNLSADHPRGLVRPLKREVKGQKSEGRRDEEAEPRPRPREKADPGTGTPGEVLTLVAAGRTPKGATSTPGTGSRDGVVAPRLGSFN